MIDPADSDLLRRIAEHGDRDAFVELYKRYEVPAFNLSLRIAGNRALAEEALQEAMLRVWKYAQTFRYGENVRSWLLRIVARQATSVYRTAKRKMNLKAKAREVLDAPLQAPPSDKAERSEILGVLNDSVAKLPALSRQMLALYYGAEFSHEEISRTLNIPRSTISLHLKRALEDLRHHMGAAGVAGAVAAPFLQAESLGRVLMESAPAPAGGCESVLSLLDGGAADSLTGASQKLAAKGSSTLAWSAGVLALLLTAAAAGYALHTPAPEMPAPPQEAAAPAEAPASPARLHKVWTFENGLPSDFTARLGVLALQPAEGPRRAALTAPPGRGFTLILPLALDGGPFKVELTVRSPRNESVHRNGMLNTSYADGQDMPGYTSWTRKTPPAFRPDHLYTVTFYYFAEHCVKTAAEAGGRPELIAVRTYDQPYPGSGLGLVAMNWAIERIAVTGLDDENGIPENLRDVQALRAELGAAPLVERDTRLP